MTNTIHRRMNLPDVLWLHSITDNLLNNLESLQNNLTQCYPLSKIKDAGIINSSVILTGSLALRYKNIFLLKKGRFSRCFILAEGRD